MKQAALIALALSHLGDAADIRGRVATADVVDATGATGGTGSAGQAGATGAESASATGASSFLAPAAGEGAWLKDIRKSVAALSSAAAEEDASRVQVCKAEKASIRQEQQQEEEEEKDDRKAQRANLADALEARVGGIARHLNKLMGLQEQLKGHIDRTNSLYQKKYVQDAREMKVASQAFESLMEHAVEGNPSESPIKVPRMPKLPGSATAGNGSTALLETRTKSRVAMHEELMRARFAASSIEEPTCASASEGALNLFHKGARYHEEIKQFFEAERKVLAAFREQLASVIKSKLAKMAKLKAQSAALRKAMAVPEVDMKKALGQALKAHEELVTNACAQMDNHTASNGPLRQALIREAAKCARAGGLGAEVQGLSAKVKAVEEDVRITKALADGATGVAYEEVQKSETGTATGAAEPASEEKPVTPIPKGKVITV